MQEETGIGIVGHGAVGSVMARSLLEGKVPGCRLTGVHARSDVPAAYGIEDFDDLLASLLGLARQNGGRLLVTTGAIGGLDILRAAQMPGPLDAVALATAKPTRAVLQPWMDDATVARLTESEEPVRVFTGTAREAAELFPRSANVAAALSLTTVGFDRVHVEITADPGATTVEHSVHATGEARFRPQPRARRASSPRRPSPCGSTASWRGEAPCHMCR